MQETPNTQQRRDRLRWAAMLAVMLWLAWPAGDASAQVLVPPGGGAAQILPPAADVNRIAPMPELLPTTAPSAPAIIPAIEPFAEVPEDLKHIRFTLTSVRIEGMSVFSDADMKDIYAEYIGKEVSLDQLWRFAGAVTERYRANEYFLTRAYVPAQEIEGGEITIRVVEGYIGTVSFKHALAEKRVVRRLIEGITKRRPIKAAQLESFMLRLNDMPGASFFGALQPLEGGDEGAIELVLKHTDVESRTLISFDNSGSRFLGPYQAGVTYQGSIIPLQETSVSTVGSLTRDELRSVSVNHQARIDPQLKVEFYGSHVNAKPGASLSQFEIDSSYSELGVGLRYEPIRQYQENLSLGLRFDGKNTNSDLFGDTALTRDRIRAVRASLQYDIADGLDGYNMLNLGVDRGIDGLGSSQPGELNLSRTEAEPDFTVGTFSLTRNQALPSALMLIAQMQGQYASGPLYSAEEFGYGGQAFGRAYDPSDIVGDHGIAGMAEMRYLGWKPWNDVQFAPYAFYDVGKVWNEDAGSNTMSGSSAGLGMRMQHPAGIGANLGVAFPLTRDIDKPLYGNGKNPRFLIQMQYGF